MHTHSYIIVCLALSHKLTNACSIMQHHLSHALNISHASLMMYCLYITYMQLCLTIAISICTEHRMDVQTRLVIIFLQASYICNCKLQSQMTLIKQGTVLYT